MARGKPGHISVVYTADTKRFNKKVQTMSDKIGRLLKMGAAVGFGAIAAGAAKSVTAFAGFENQINEVRTLLPDIDDGAMKALSDDIRGVSKEFGIAHSEAVPALYQALSAGVPPDNVIDFMDVAAKAAIGGVTDLETAVDGISTVVNGYGAEVISAQQASDIMFTSVRLGKTTYEELAASLSNVTPLAAAVGVSFEEVSASIAVLTAQGVPTAQATTQIRGALAELSKEGSKADKVFKEITGKSFPEFIEQGGTFGDALALIAEHAEENDIQLQNVFSRVEAGTAILALAKGDMGAYNAALEEMGDSAGATEKAHETMDKGIGRTWSKLKVHVTDLAITVGEKLSPHLDKVMDWLIDVLPKIKAFALDVKDKLETPFKNWTGRVKTVVEKLVDLGKWIADNKPVIAALAVMLTATLVPALVAVTTAIWAKVAALAALAVAALPITGIVLGVAAAAAGVVILYQKFKWFADKIDWIADKIGWLGNKIKSALGFSKSESEKMVDDVEEMFTKAAGAADRATVLREWRLAGKNLLDEYSEEQISMEPDVQKALSDMLQDVAKDTGMDPLALAEMLGLGETLTQAIVDGIDNNMSDIEATLLAGVEFAGDTKGTAGTYEWAGEQLMERFGDGLIEEGGKINKDFKDMVQKVADEAGVDPLVLISWLDLPATLGHQLQEGWKLEDPKLKQAGIRAYQASLRGAQMNPEEWREGGRVWMQNLEKGMEDEENSLVTKMEGIRQDLMDAFLGTAAPEDLPVGSPGERAAEFAADRKHDEDVARIRAENARRIKAEQDRFFALTGVRLSESQVRETLGIAPEPTSAEGGYFTKPVKTWVGEAGPEWVIPANRMPGASPLPAGGMGGGVKVVINIDKAMGLDARSLMRDLATLLPAALKHEERGRGRVTTGTAQ